MDDATIGGLFGLLRCRGGHDEHASAALGEVIEVRKRAVLLALRRSGLALLAHARGRRQVWTRTTRPRSAGPWRQLGIELIAAYSPRGPGPLGAHVRDLAEAPAPGAAPRRDRHHGRGQSRFCEELYLAGAQRPLRPCRPRTTGSAFVAFAGTLEDILRASRRTAIVAQRQHRARQAAARCRSRPIATATTTSRHQVRVHEYLRRPPWPSSTDPAPSGALSAPTAKRHRR